MDILLKSDKELLKNNELINAKWKHNEFGLIMAIYQKALDDTLQKFISLKQLLNEYYNCNFITDVI